MVPRDGDGRNLSPAQVEICFRQAVREQLPFSFEELAASVDVLGK
jgi:hypothetical protein